MDAHQRESICMNIDFFYIPDYHTGTKVHTLDTLLENYTEDGIVVYVLRMEGRSRPTYLTSYGRVLNPAGKRHYVADWIVAEHTQTQARLEGRLLNIVQLDGGKVTHAENDIGLRMGDKGSHWCMK